MSKLDIVQVGLLCDQDEGWLGLPKDAMEVLAGELPPPKTRVLLIDYMSTDVGDQGRPLLYPPIYRQIHVYDPIKNTDEVLLKMIPSSFMPGRISGMSATALNDNRILICSNHVQEVGVVPYALIVDPFSTASTARTAPYIFLDSDDCREFACRTWASLITLIDGRVMRIGGYKGDLAPGDAALFDPATLKWSLVEGAPMMATGAFSILLENGRVLITGGMLNNLDISSACWLYDPSSNVFTATGSLNTARQRHAGCFLKNGNILVCGGATANQIYMFAAEEYNIASGKWTKINTPYRSCLDPHCTLLPDGRISIIEHNGTCSFYDPSNRKTPSRIMKMSYPCVVVAIL